ncbi:MAG TPA: hypothetical protein VGG25_15580, partial [Streptosporangiaceae bacterium]
MLVVAPVIVGLRFGVRITVALYVFEVILLLALSLTILFRGGASGLSATPFQPPTPRPRGSSSPGRAAGCGAPHWRESPPGSARPPPRRSPSSRRASPS